MLRKLFFSLIYYQRPVWDTGISPPELISFIATHEPGKALDMGCGTGTNAITLAKAGWQVLGVDFASRAIQLAKKKARKSGVSIDFHREDVTHLDTISGGFDLILDIGCFHTLPDSKQAKYIANVNRLLKTDGTFLLYTFFKENMDAPIPGVTKDSIKHLSDTFQLVDRKDGTDRGIRPSAWLTFQKSSR